MCQLIGSGRPGGELIRFVRSPPRPGQLGASDYPPSRWNDASPHQNSSYPSLCEVLDEIEIATDCSIGSSPMGWWGKECAEA